jgi:hypothetical protein
MIADIGGENIDDFTKRTMGRMLTPDLARQFNLTGQQRKRRFISLKLSDAFFGMIPKIYIYIYI